MKSSHNGNRYFSGVVQNQVLEFFKPYAVSLGALILVSVILSLISGASQVALTPLLEIVLGGTEQAVPAPAAGFSFDLNNIGLSVLQFVQHITGLTDRFQLLLVSTITYLALVLIGQGLGFATRIWAYRLQLVMAHSLEHRLIGHIFRLPMSLLDHQRIGALQQRLVSDINQAMNTVSDLIIDGLTSILLSAFYILLLVKTDIRLTLIAAFAGIVQLGISQILSRTARERTIESVTTGADLGAFRQELLASIREIKLHSAERYEEKRFFDMVRQFVSVMQKYKMYKSIERPARISLNRVIVVVIMLFGAWELLNGHLTVAAFVLFMFFAQNLTGPLSQVASIILNAVEIRAMLSGVISLFELDQEPSGTKIAEPSDFQHELRICNLSFQYADKPVLHHINLTIPKSKVIALVGQSGAGKSTLVDLILRLYLPTQGHIEMDGVPIHEFNLQGYRRLFGVVSQSTTLFNDTVYNNIAYSHPELTQDDIIRAARIANAEEFIVNDLPNGYDTILGERGVLLSGGQRQRIAIARAVVHQPPILIMDEATSALDTESERLVQDAIEKVIQNCTAIIIAHRLSTILKADQIVVMRGGRIIETGTHDELLARGGEYHYLYQLQFQEQDPLPLRERDSAR